LIKKGILISNRLQIACRNLVIFLLSQQGLSGQLMEHPCKKNYITQVWQLKACKVIRPTKQNKTKQNKTTKQNLASMIQVIIEKSST
jgi:hypothetical protein